MNWKEFIVTLIDNMAWPTVAIVIFFVLRTQIGNLIGKIAHLKYKDLEVDFDELKKSVEAASSKLTENIVTQDSRDKQIYQSMEEQIMKSVETAPSASILLAWSAVETAMSSAVSRLAISAESPAYRSPLHNIDALEKGSKLSKEQIKLIHEMRMLRNKVAHEDQTRLNISETQARDYATASTEIIDLLNRIKMRGKIIRSPKGVWSQKPDNFQELTSKKANLWMFSSIPIPNTNLIAGSGPWKEMNQEDSNYQCYGIAIEKTTPNGSTPIAELTFSLDYVDSDILEKSASDIITYDIESKEITFNLGKAVFKYQLM